MASFYERVADSAHEAHAKLLRFATSLRNNGLFEEANEAEELAIAMRKLGFDALLETQPIEIRERSDPKE